MGCASRSSLSSHDKVGNSRGVSPLKNLPIFIFIVVVQSEAPGFGAGHDKNETRDRTEVCWVILVQHTI